MLPLMYRWPRRLVVPLLLLAAACGDPGTADPITQDGGNTVHGVLELSPTTADFGPTFVGEAPTLPLTAFNNGQARLAISGITVSGEGFQVLGPALPWTLQPGETLELTIRFMPARDGAFTGSVTVSSDAGETSVALSGLALLPPEVMVMIDPPTATVVPQDDLRFTATVTGATNTNVTWFVNGTQGGNSSLGTITGAGRYIAPLCPSTANLTITAKSVADPTKTADATVTIVGATSQNTKHLWVASNGSDSNAGTSCKPFATINKASTLVVAGGTVHVLPGTYNQAPNTAKDGTATARVRYLSTQQWGAKIRSSGTAQTWLNSGDYVDIFGFDVSGDGRNGILNQGSFVRVVGNHVHDLPASCSNANTAAGIHHANTSASGNDTIGNWVHDIGTANAIGACGHVNGIFHAMPGGVIQNNVAFENTAGGIQLGASARAVTVSNNLVFQNNTGIIVGADAGTNDNSVVNNNIVMRNVASGVVELGSTGTNNEYVANHLFQNATNLQLKNGNTATQTVFGDPKMVNYLPDGGGNYHLTSASPGIGAGVPQGAPAFDYDGSPRGDGGVDIGPYEFGGTAGAWPYL